MSVQVSPNYFELRRGRRKNIAMAESGGIFLVSERLYMRPPELKDYKEWTALRKESEDFLKPWEPTWLPDALSEEMYKELIAFYQHEMENGTGISFFIFQKNPKRLLGEIVLSNVRRGCVETGTIGYWIGLPYINRGYMTEALGMLAQCAFEKFELHRLEAGCLLRNKPSRMVLKKTGFRLEGIGRSYYQIQDKWEDHYLFALLKGDEIWPLQKENSPKGFFRKLYRKFEHLAFWGWFAVQRRLARFLFKTTCPPR